MNKQIEESTVRYCLYPKLENEDQITYQNYIDEQLLKFLSFITSYYWYYTSFNLKFIPKDISHSKITHIEGCTNFDENIEDEWFIVFILYEISKQDPELVIHLEDSDGFFLLIEAADFLPKWANHKTCTNRCFIYRGQLHLIPLQESFILNKNFLQQALEKIRNPSIKTICSIEIQKKINERIQDYPSKINDSFQNCKVILPSKIAFLLNEDPTLICHAARAFYYRDDNDLKTCRIMKNFLPKDLVNRVLKISKFNYAQLLGQNYKPDFKLGWNLPFPDSENFKKIDLGVKISCGFEILVSNFESSKKEFKENEENIKNEALSNFYKSKNFEILKENNLNVKSYFENCLLTEITKNSSFIDYCFIGQKINKILENYSDSKFLIYKKEENNLPEVESDGWLNEIPDFLLDGEKSQSFDDLPEKITNCLQEFIKTDSDYKGIEIDENSKKRKSGLKDRALNMMSNNLRSIITMKVSDSESNNSESDLSDYNYSSTFSDDESTINELSYLKKSSKKIKKKSKKKPENKKKKVKNEVELIMNAMDEELSTTEVGKTFEKLNIKNNVPMASCPEFDFSSEEEKDNKVGLNDIDLKYNTVKNLFESFKEQNGLSGPTSNILKTLGVNLPKDTN